ncbi:acetoin reductase family [Pyrrhoderma noxium]|uniref:3-oxoacyl-[acyl-carrier-protein] reductase n=1 Tax=Pyrrhoderma noxium TaxID=2282107 RepID=A0A286U6N6_9AGAM|nr:acetoin reductase family [Pyrrhoderma noxium]
MSITTKGIAVVTGAAQGIGRAIALRLARDGYDISVNDLNTNKKNLETVTNEITGVGRRVYPFIGDVSKEEDVKNLVSKTAKELGSVDVMVANAGIEHWQPIIESFKLLSAYSASKFAVRGLTQTAALELGKYGITVNAYAPGIIDTSMFDSLDKFLSKEDGKEAGFYKKYYVDTPPIHRLGTPEDIAAVVSFLASKDASFITGQSISTNGGLYFD